MNVENESVSMYQDSTIICILENKSYV